MPSQRHPPPEHLFLVTLTKTSHCSKLKMYLEASITLKSDLLPSLEIFGNGFKAALDMMLCSHYSFSPYNKWALNYLVTTTLCPPEFRDHPQYPLMCINFNAFGQVHRFMWNGTMLTFDKSPDAFHALNPLRHISCGWTLFQELVWACSPHIMGHFETFSRAYVRVSLSLVKSLRSTYNESKIYPKKSIFAETNQACNTSSSIIFSTLSVRMTILV
jgi:hypothetical protein